MKATVAIIPARGGSKRIPGKNIKNFHGRPIIAYSIQAALTSGCFDEVMVSTDSEEIAAVARERGATVPFLRSLANSDDHAGTEHVLEEVLSEYRKRGREFARACCIYATAPFVTAKKLLESARVLDDAAADAVVSIVRFSHPIQRALRLREGAIEFMWPGNINARSQDLEAAYHDAGQFYWFDVKRFFETHTLFMPKTLGFELPESEVQDIDSEADWKSAELKYQSFCPRPADSAS